MESEFVPGTIPNVLQILCDEQALLLMDLSTASNDLSVNVEAIGKFPITESSYFLYSSISIVREIAKLIVKIEDSNFLETFSDNSKSIFSDLHDELSSFEDLSLAKQTLKPIRDLTFHYDFGESSVRENVVLALHQLRKEGHLEIGLKAGADSPLGQRYLFADRFRSDVINQFLSEKLVSKVSAVSVNILRLVDSLISDLVAKQRTK